MTNTETAANPKLARVRALLAKAESTEFPGEAESYRERAYALMASHGIDEAMLAASRKSDDKPVQRVIVVDDPYRRDKQGLLYAVAEPLGVKAIRIAGTNTSVLVGFENDLDRVEMLFTSLLLQAFDELGKIKSEDVLPIYHYLSSAQKRSGRAAYNRSWLAGFANTVLIRLREATARAAQQYEAEHHTSTELVVVDRTKRVAVAYKEFFPKVRTSSRNLSGNGYGAGVKAGNRADIGNTRVGGQRSVLNG